ncbi:MAG: tryptophan-rich sensory protein [Pyrinomonadaceae bacterium]
MSDKNERIKQILVIVATAGVILINYLAGTGRIAGVTPEMISDKYPTLLTPAGYAFSIWGLIYFGLLAFSIFQFTSAANAARYAKIRSLYILSCAANCAWIWLWHHEQIVLSLIAIFVLLGTLVLINIQLIKTESPAEFLAARLPFNIYFGWVTAASVVNFAIAMVFLGVKTTDSTAAFLACVLMVAVTILGIVIRIKLANAAFAVAVAWALTAIAVKQNHQTNLIIVAAFGVIALLISALTYFLQTPKTIE